MSVKAALVSLSLAAGLVAPPLAHAFDIQAGVSKESGPFDLFKFGFNAYKKGKKEDAVEAYRYAAEKGHTGSRWALANMYADGDGVAQNDFEAFKIYSEIANQGVEPGSDDTGFFVNALMALAGYYRTGIDNSPVRRDLAQARQIYFQAASAFGISEAQYQLGRMMMDGEGGSQSTEQAKKWLNRARKNGHAGATGLFGSIIFQEGQSVRGLALLTLALDRCSPKDCGWIQELQEQAFSLAPEKDRRAGIAMAQSMGSAASEPAPALVASETIAPVPEKQNGFQSLLSRVFKGGNKQETSPSANAFQRLNASSLSSAE